MNPFRTPDFMSSPIFQNRERSHSMDALEGLNQRLREIQGFSSETGQWLDWLALNREQVISYITQEWGLRKAIIKYDVMVMAEEHIPNWHSDPLSRLNMALLVNLLHVALPEIDSAIPGALTLEESTKKIIRGLIAEYVEANRRQADSLVKACRDFAAIASEVSPEGTFVLIEMPIGNSVPCRLVESFLGEQGRRVDTLLCGFPRKNNKIKKEVLDKHVKETGIDVSAAQTLLYLDEWNSGSNFKEACRLLSSSESLKQCKLLAGALLAPEANSHNRYSSHCGAHDRLTQNTWGNRVDSEALRYPISPMQSGLFSLMGTPFMWGEYDRLSGYRKMQFVGSIVSSLHEAVDELKNNGELRRRLAASFFASVDPDLLQRPRMLAAHIAFSESEMSDSAFTDYESIKEQLDNIEDTTNEGILDDPVSSISRITKKVEEIIEGRRCNWLAKLGVLRLQQRLKPDPANRYHNPFHTAVFSPLEGRSLFLRDSFVAEVKKGAAR